MVQASQPPRRQRQRKTSFEVSLLKFLIQFGTAIALAFGLFVSYLNVRAYVQLILWLQPEREPNAVQALLLKIPFVGFIADKASWAIIILAAIVLWALVQVVQVLPDAIENSQKSLALTIMNYHNQRGERMEVDEEDPAIIKRLVRAYNKIPVKWVETLKNFQGFAFAIDGILAICVYRPLNVDLDTFLLTKSADAIDWVNVGIIVACVFTANILLQIVTVIQQGNRHLKLQERFDDGH